MEKDPNEDSESPKIVDPSGENDQKDQSDESEAKDFEEPLPIIGLKLRTLILLIVSILIIRSSVISPYHVPTPSMEPTIKVGDRLLAFKAAYDLRIPFTDIVLMNWGQPKRGDIVIFRYPKNPSEYYVKRVVALGGDSIQIKDDILIVNDQASERLAAEDMEGLVSDILDGNQKQVFQESLFGHQYYISHDISETRRFGQSQFPARQPGALVVPEDSVFVLGDNRDRSDDSRTWGEVPLRNVVGKATFVLWSVWDQGGDSWPTVRWARSFSRLR